MDAIVSAALEEICAGGAAGTPIPSLFPAIAPAFAAAGLPASSAAVRRVLWSRLLALPGLRFSSPSTSLEEAESSGVVVLAEDHLRDNFVGLYDRHASKADIPPIQRRALERLAAARTRGVTQRELAKEFGIKGNNIFYVVKNLESQELIVRQSTVIRAEKESGIVGENEIESTSIVNTNTLHLRRYAKNMSSNSQQRIEITRTDLLEGTDNADGSSPVGSGASRECVKEVVCVKDFLPAMRAVCDKLEVAKGKVLVVSDIKVDLGYTAKFGHRAWRNILNRLKEASLVEEFEGKNNNKVVNCLRLLKKFDPKIFQPKANTHGYDGFQSEHVVQNGKRGQITDQFFELPIDHRIYDMVVATGVRGITIPEICGRLGLGGKRIHKRITDVCSRYGIHMRSEFINKTALYRLWTSKNYQHHLNNVFSDKSEVIPVINELSTESSDLIPFDQSCQHLQMLHPTDDNFHSDVTNNAQFTAEISSTFTRQTGQRDTQMILSGTADRMGEYTNMGDAEPGCATRVTESVLPSEGAFSVSATFSKNDNLQGYKRFTSHVVSQLREQRIIKRLENEKFILAAELHRWLEGLKKDQPTMMDRKTLNRTLNKLQQEGMCKLIQVSIPVVTNFSTTRACKVILHPSVGTLSSDLLEQLYRSQRQFDIQIRRASSRSKSDQPLTELPGVNQSSSRVAEKPECIEARRANGFVTAKMVRVKLLHNFLWSYLSSLPNWHNTLKFEDHGDALKNPSSNDHMFALGAAIKAMPLELFLQVVGSKKEIDGMLEYCRLGLRLLDLPAQQYKCLMDTQATGRLSSMVQILIRLKLIRLASEGLPEDVSVLPHAVFTHALELKPYIEEPLPRAIPSLNVNASDFLPRVRHDFVLSNQDAVDAYWDTLEYCYAAADPTIASHAFPGSAVNEVFQTRSWTSVKVMTAEQRTKLLKHVGDDRSRKKLLFEECVKIAKELSLTVEQVLRVYYDTRRYRIRTYHRSPETKVHENHEVSKKRKSSSLKLDTRTRGSGGQISSSSDVSEQHVRESLNAVASNENHDSQLQEYNDDYCVNCDVHSDPSDDQGETCTFISHCAFPRSPPKRQKKFPWTDSLDRQLVMQYARYRATRGAKSHRVDWTVLSDLPATPQVCRRRMALLRSNEKIRKAVMNLCNLLAKLYTRHLSETNIIPEKQFSCYDSSQSVPHFSSNGTFVRNLLVNPETASTSNSQLSSWDDVGHPDIKMAVDEVFRYKRLAKLGYPKKDGPTDEKDWPDITPTEGTRSDVGECRTTNAQDEVQTGPDDATVTHVNRRPAITSNSRRTRRRKPISHQPHRDFLKLLNRRGGRIRRSVSRSLAVANAIELLKLVFLSTSSAPEVQTKLTTLLKLYSEYDLFEAFNYLREKRFMDIGHGSRPYVLSRKFLQNASSSPFPIDSGKRAANFSSWLLKHEKELVTDGVSLTSDLQCGEIFHLFALASMEELFISPCLPKEGIGEVDEPMSSKSVFPTEYIGQIDEPKSRKRKCENGKLTSWEKDKKQKPQAKIDVDLCPRREKGFPGIKVLLNHATLRENNAVNLTALKTNANISLLYELKTQLNSCSSLEIIGSSCLSSNSNTCRNFYVNKLRPDFQNESPCDAMSKYAAFMSSRSVGTTEAVSFSPGVFKSVYSAIRHAGEHGLSMEEIAEVMDIQGVRKANIFVDTLEVFQLVIKVNSYDSIRIVDSSYRSKYFISTDADHCQDNGLTTYLKSRVTSYVSSEQLHLEKCDSIQSSKNVASLNLSDGHRVSILGLPADAALTRVEMQHVEDVVSFENPRLEAAPDQVDDIAKNTYPDSGSRGSWPILPWINGDGSMNTDMYKGLSRRLLGIVMQNPGILEENIFRRMDVLNPQSCRELMALMITDNHITVRLMKQSTVTAPPGILRSVIRSNVKKVDPGFRKHYFANPMSTYML